MDAREQVEKLRGNLGAAIRGKPDVINAFLAAVLSGGHVLIEDVPGTGKTTLAKAMARSLNAKFSRIQFTPDLLPTDILGGMVYKASDGSFSFRAGPVFANVILADEINRASPRTQSALLEAMAEKQISIEGETLPLPAPFLVIATQNPVEYNGTYPLPEAQLDRFCMRISLGYPGHSDETLVLKDHAVSIPLNDISPVLDTAGLVLLQSAVRKVETEDSILDYIVRIVGRTRTDPRVKLGAGPRGSLDLRRCAQAKAFSDGRDFVRPEDVRSLASAVLAHRILVDVKSAHGGITGQTIVADAVKSEKVPA